MEERRLGDEESRCVDGERWRVKKMEEIRKQNKF
jgi:hypothetical protein